MTTSPQARLIYSASKSDANVLWATQFFARQSTDRHNEGSGRIVANSPIMMDVFPIPGPTILPHSLRGSH